MTKEQAQTKLGLLPLTATVAVDNSTDEDNRPVIEFSYQSGGATISIALDLVPTATQLNDLVNNLPLLPANKLASLAIMLTPSLPGQEGT